MDTNQVSDCEVEDLIELLVEIAGLQRLQLFWSESSTEDAGNVARNEILSDMLERKIAKRDIALREVKRQYPEIEQFAWGQLAAFDA